MSASPPKMSELNKFYINGVFLPEEEFEEIANRVDILGILRRLNKEYRRRILVREEAIKRLLSSK